jgi:hypothetical protein
MSLVWSACHMPCFQFNTSWQYLRTM